MAISMIAGYGQVQNIYAFRNTHFNQVQNAPVTPVSRARGVAPIADDEDRTVWVGSRATRQAGELESAAVEKQTQKIRESVDSGQELQYDISNPYEAVRMSIDSMLVTGMNINVMA